MAEVVCCSALELMEGAGGAGHRQPPPARMGMSKSSKKPVRSSTHLVLAGRKNAAHATKREKARSKYPKAWKSGGDQ